MTFSLINVNFDALYKSIDLKREFFIQEQLFYFNKKYLRIFTSA